MIPCRYIPISVIVLAALAILAIRWIPAPGAPLVIIFLGAEILMRVECGDCPLLKFLGAVKKRFQKNSLSPN